MESSGRVGTAADFRFTYGKEVGTGRTAFAYEKLVRLKHLYGVSMWALLYRLKDVGIISEANLKNLFRTPARAWLRVPQPQSPGQREACSMPGGVAQRPLSTAAGGAAQYPTATSDKEVTQKR